MDRRGRRVVGGGGVGGGYGQEVRCVVTGI